MKKRIPVSEITKRHPGMAQCSTDKEYAALANELYDQVAYKLPFMVDEEIRNTCVSLALYFEDIHSGTHQFETFTRIYGRMYGYYVPFHDSVDASAPEAELDAMRFVIWLVISAEREGRITNPQNGGIRQLAEELLRYWQERKNSLPPNEELAEYIYSDQAQGDPYLIRDVLVWLQNRSFLGRWYSNPIIYEDYYDCKRFLPKMRDNDLTHITEAFSVFDNPSWPLSLPTTHIYAEMIRMDMDDPQDELAADIEKIEYAELGLYKLLDADEKCLTIEDFRGRRLLVLRSSFGSDIRKLQKGVTHIYGSFFTYLGEWYCNGLSAFVSVDEEIYKSYCREESERYSYFHDHVGQYDEFVRQHDGQRLFFFKNFEGLAHWMKVEMGINTPDQEQAFDLFDDEPLMLFFEPNGQTTVSTYATCVESPKNPYYDREEAEAEGATLLANPDIVSSDMILYLIEKNLIPDAMFDDINGDEHGKRLLQENADFVARCLRRNIKTEEVVRRRDDFAIPDTGNISLYDAPKVDFSTFVHVLSQEDIIRSKARKEWRVKRCNQHTTVILDVAKGKEYAIPTDSLYEAYRQIDKDDFQISTVARYVGKANASAASALLYCTVGKGHGTNELDKSLRHLYELIGKIDK